MGYYLALTLWKYDFDPDVYALPLLSSSIDCIGQLMLVAAFKFARYIDGSTLSSNVVIPG